MNSTNLLLSRRKGAWSGVALIAGVGVLLLFPPLGEIVAWRSLDLLFPLRPNIEVTNVVMVYLDDASHERLEQPSIAGWNRALHARLLDRLARTRARAVVFDIWFDGPTTNDSVLLEAIARATNAGTRVVLAGFVASEGMRGGNAVHRAVPPSLRATNNTARIDPPPDDVAPWGVVQAGGAASVHREHYRPLVAEPSLAWRVAELTMPIPPSDPDTPRWLNFYGPPGHLKFHSYHRVLEPGAIPDEAFSNKVVFVGANAGVGFTGGHGTDHFESPYLGSQDRFPGVELNAVAYLNLARQDWLIRLPWWFDLTLVLGAAAALVFGLGRGRPGVALVGAAVAGALLLALTGLLAWWLHRWFPWLVVAVGQIPAALGWALFNHTRRITPERTPGESKPASDAALASSRAGSPPPAVTPAESPTASSAASPGLAPSVPAGPVIPDHALLKLVGTGAYGEIWIARNAIGTYHAVKIIHRASFDSDEPYEREFRGLQKFMPVSRSHPGLVQILHIGRNDREGLIYYSMEPADDEMTGTRIAPSTYSPSNLSRRIKQRGHLPAGECLRLAVPLAAALGHLHRHRLLHRDIKPANIIFVEGAPKLADIGLVTEVSSTARDVTFVGTQGYIPPEGPGQPAADVFALGLVLYEALTGLHRDRFPELPDDALQRPDASLFLELNDLILKACAPEADGRYPDGQAFHAELARLCERPGSGPPLNGN